jgi:hypothetical protein
MENKKTRLKCRRIASVIIFFRLAKNYATRR